MKKEILKIFNKLTNTVSIWTTLFTSIFGKEWLLFAGYLILNILDYITGTVKCKVKKEESSNKGSIGIIKKVCYWILIGLAFFISYLLIELGNKININLDFIMLFGWFTLTCLIINESRSILENLIEIGIKVPSFLITGLNTYYNLIEKRTSISNDEKDKK